jgi:hypothetical protein
VKKQRTVNGGQKDVKHIKRELQKQNKRCDEEGRLKQMGDGNCESREVMRKQDMATEKVRSTMRGHMEARKWNNVN